ncbi:MULTISPECIES: Acg family FMN-binding oxidoreductase [unclassified Streptomyces]|uniref:Acg family FMN-binding oxidoreductase n=1 Tax=unclassified Streptomyces TaxID=2593676 RepID=UPI0036ED467C
MSLTYESAGRAALHLARAASLAPSPHNSQPWSFVEEGHDHGFEVHLDDARRMMLTDPGGREAVIACGAALFNARLAVRLLGFRPVVDLLPEPGNTPYLARVGYASYAQAEPDEALLARALPRRHTHRGPFGPVPVPDTLLDELRDDAQAEGAVLRVVDEPEGLRRLAHLVRTAEDAHRADSGHVAELARCVGPHGVPRELCRHHPDGTLLAGRDYLGLSWYYVRRPQRWSPRTGTVAVLSSRYDSRQDWLRSGQALQRVLLRAASRDVMAAFHTQPLELPGLRTKMRTDLMGGLFPQVVLRLGCAARMASTPRRAPIELLDRW